MGKRPVANGSKDPVCPALRALNKRLARAHRACRTHLQRFIQQQNAIDIRGQESALVDHVIVRVVRGGGIDVLRLGH